MATSRHMHLHPHSLVYIWPHGARYTQDLPTDSETHGQFLTLLDLMCVLCLQGEPGDPGEDGRKVSCPRVDSALAQTGAGSEAALSSLGREGRFRRPWERSECWRLLQSLTPDPGPNYQYSVNKKQKGLTQSRGCRCLEDRSLLYRVLRSRWPLW